MRVELTGKAARALNAALHTSLFARGVPLGRATVNAKLAQLAPRGGSTALAVDPGALSALTSLGITPGLVDPASADKSGAFRFPITGGVVDAKTLAGRIRHSGGISLTKGSTIVELTRFDIAISGTPQLTALVGGTRVPILDLDLSGITTSVKGLARHGERRARDAHRRGRGRAEPGVRDHGVPGGPAARHRHGAGASSRRKARSGRGRLR